MEKTKNLKVREDLNEIVKSIGFKRVVTDFGERKFCLVEFFNGEKIEFKDKNGVYDLLNAYAKSGVKLEEVVKSKRLVECLKNDEDGNATSTYICVEYVFADGTIEKLFPTKFISNKIIDVYYSSFKNNQKNQK